MNKRPKICPETKVLNPKTGRCTKKCKQGFSRNGKFQCRKNTTIKNVAKIHKLKEVTNISDTSTNSDIENQRLYNMYFNTKNIK